jgi:hypothetical protein
LSRLPVVYQSGDDPIYELPSGPSAHLVTQAELPDQDVLAHPISMSR